MPTIYHLEWTSFGAAQHEEHTCFVEAIQAGNSTYKAYRIRDDTGTLCYRFAPKGETHVCGC